MKQTGIVDRFEGDFVVVETGEDKFVNIPRKNAPQMLAEGMVVILEGDRIIDIDALETQRIEDDMRRRFERLLGKKTD